MSSEFGLSYEVYSYVAGMGSDAAPCEVSYVVESV